MTNVKDKRPDYLPEKLDPISAVPTSKNDYSLLKRRDVQAGLATGAVATGTQAKWLADAYSYNSSLEDIGSITTETESGGGFFPWPHHGEKIICQPSPPYYRECQPRGVPDMDPISKGIHDYLNTHIPLSQIPVIGHYLPDIPVAPLVAAAITLGATYGIYKYKNWRAGHETNKAAKKLGLKK